MFRKIRNFFIRIFLTLFSFILFRLPFGKRKLVLFLYGKLNLIITNLALMKPVYESDPVNKRKYNDMSNRAKGYRLGLNKKKTLPANYLKEVTFFVLDSCKVNPYLKDADLGNAPAAVQLVKSEKEIETEKE